MKNKFIHPIKYKINKFKTTIIIQIKFIKTNILSNKIQINVIK
jgi:hypothetical protein